MEMALAMTHINNIKDLYHLKGLNVAEISRITGHDRKTINKYLNKTDFNKTIKKKTKRGSKLDPFKPLIDSWLEADKKERRKQRHTAKRIHKRLKEKYNNEFDCSYRLVADYVRLKKEELYRLEKDFYFPLQHKAGEAQVDFGLADFIESGKRYSGHSLNISFPQSNCGYLQLFKGENLQCLMEGLINIFEYIGGVPSKIVFDNASTMVTNILKNQGRKLTDDFIRFKNHFGFTPVFCNPASGHEKGSVENKVGYQRRNYLVPVPIFKDINEFNKELLTRLDNDQLREHYRKNDTIFNLFQNDLKALIPLPASEFDTSKLITKRSDSYACISLNGGRHRYSIKPSYARSNLHIKLTADKVIILDPDLKEVISHKRLYGDRKQESFNWIPYLTQLSRRPRALKYTGIYDLFPNRVKDYLDNLEKDSLKDILKTLSSLTEKSSFTKAVNALLEAIDHGVYDSDSIEVLFARNDSSILSLNPVLMPEKAPEMPELRPDITTYDSFYTVADGND